MRLAAIAAAAWQIKAKTFTIDGEAVVLVLAPDGLSRFEELHRREAADTAILYPFDLVGAQSSKSQWMGIPRP